MSNSLLSMALATLLAGQALATPDDDRLLVTPKLGWMLFGSGADVDDAMQFGGSLGMMFNPSWGMEAGYSWISTSRTNDDLNVDVSLLDAALLWFPLWERRFQPYLSAGWGTIRLDADDIAGVDGNYGGFQFGAGAKLDVMERETWRLALRLEVKDTLVSFDFPGAESGTGSNFLVSAGLSLEFGTDSHKDTDGDGVIDKIDLCPGTALGVVVDAQGCGIDSDGDGVFDGPDLCPATPLGAEVDPTGCPSDGDKDGVLNGLDGCPETPAGALVDSLGCEFDTDSDGVLDGLDLCNSTPIGVDVDEDGCPTVDSPEELRLYTTGTLILPEIEFESGKAELKEGSGASLAVIAAAMRKWPDLIIEVGGHTDDRGSERKNQEVSQERAEAVRKQLILSTGTISDERLIAKGYGPSQPVADNATEEGRNQNRRVQFTILSGGPVRDQR